MDYLDYLDFARFRECKAEKKITINILEQVLVSYNDTMGDSQFSQKLKIKITQSFKTLKLLTLSEYFEKWQTRLEKLLFRTLRQY